MKIILGITIGGILGFLVGYFGKCSPGLCPLKHRPVVSTIVGALLGLLIAIAR
ncbi:MAG: DUF6132 family protein [Candidatus Omnitrophica bacterium]|nr:DUF6132 family protein [Candidatus Omnitrophota bacterium]MDD5236165.1 DUF6132 family protein [Candidatus Omnitrophota bacterium]MDD5610939.1 DUF6132 family protein [Candidatus Omnitrophota bacterium]